MIAKDFGKEITAPKLAKLTKEVVAKAQRLEITDAKCTGLRLMISATGKQSWVLGCRDNEGKPRRFQLGDYGALSLTDARQAAIALRHKVRHEGADPIAEARSRRAEAKVEPSQDRDTLQTVLDRYTEQQGKQLRSWPHSSLRIGRVFAHLLDKPLATLTVRDLQQAADRYPAAASGSFAVRTLRPVLNWAAHPGRAYVNKDLCEISEPSKVVRRKRILSEDELRAVFLTLRRLDRPHTQAMQCMLLTLARLTEVCEATWSEIEYGAWRLPAARTKNGEPHIVPLSRQAQALLHRIAPASPDPAALIFPGARGRVLGNWDRAQKSVFTHSGTSDWHRHDLRRTGATLLGELGVMPAIVEAALNHVHIGSALAATYNRARYRPEVAVALQQLADHLDVLCDGEAGPCP